jgi:hypothetical protein
MWGCNERHAELQGERAVEFLLRDQALLDEKFIGRNPGDVGKDRSVPQGLGGMAVAGQEADLDRQSC